MNEVPQFPPLLSSPSQSTARRTGSAVVCIEWCATNGSCVKGQSCPWAAGHVLPISDEMRKASKAIIIARYPNVAVQCIARSFANVPEDFVQQCDGRMMAAGISQAVLRALPAPKHSMPVADLALDRGMICLEVERMLRRETHGNHTDLDVLALASTLPQQGRHGPGKLCFCRVANRYYELFGFSEGQAAERKQWLSDDLEEWEEHGYTLYLKGQYSRYRPLPAQGGEPEHGRLMNLFGPPSHECLTLYNPSMFAKFHESERMAGRMYVRPYLRYVEDRWLEHQTGLLPPLPNLVGNPADAIAHADRHAYVYRTGPTDPFTTLDVDAAYYQAPSAPPEPDESFCGLRKGFLKPRSE